LKANDAGDIRIDGNQDIKTSGRGRIHQPTFFQTCHPGKSAAQQS
jgi:hypothetical protein